MVFSTFEGRTLEPKVRSALRGGRAGGVRALGWGQPGGRSRRIAARPGARPGPQERGAPADSSARGAGWPWLREGRS